MPNKWLPHLKKGYRWCMRIQNFQINRPKLWMNSWKLKRITKMAAQEVEDGPEDYFAAFNMKEASWLGARVSLETTGFGSNASMFCDHKYVYRLDRWSTAKLFLFAFANCMVPVSTVMSHVVVLCCFRVWQLTCFPLQDRVGVPHQCERELFFVTPKASIKEVTTFRPQQIVQLIHQCKGSLDLWSLFSGNHSWSYWFCRSLMPPREWLKLKASWRYRVR